MKQHLPCIKQYVRVWRLKSRTTMTNNLTDIFSHKIQPYHLIY